MTRRGAAIVVWALLLAVAALIVARARYSADLSAFLPRAPTASQRLLVEQLRQGVASRLIIVAIEGADEASRARLSKALAERLRAQPRFVSVENGDRATRQRDQAFVFAHRYLLSDTVTPQRFTVAGLRAAISGTIDSLASPAGLLTESMVPSDPTGEMMTLIGQLGQRQPPRTLDGVWASRNGKRALLIVQTRAAGSDTDGQEHAVNAIRSAFDAARAAQHVRASLQMTGPGVFAVEARSHIKREVTRLSIVSSVLILALLILVYRSWPPLLLGLVPVASGAVAGIAAVALGFGVVQGVTLGFGVTLIGEGVDYSIYLFVQSRSRAGSRASAGSAGSAGSARSPEPALSADSPAPATAWAGVWPTIRLGVLTSVFGFASLLPSGFPGLAQLGLYSLTGVLAAGLATRFVLPALLPRDFMIRDLSPIGRVAQRVLDRVSAGGAVVAIIALASAIVLYLHRGRLFSHELSALSPVPEAAQRLDGKLRADLGAPDVRYLVVVSAPDRQAALQGAEEVGRELDGLIARNVISGFESPALYLPSRAVQLARQQSLPPAAVLQARLTQALAGLPLRASRLAPFVSDVESARRGPLLTRQALAGTSFASLVDSLLVREGARWHALLPLDAPTSGPHAFSIDFAQVRQAVSAAAPAKATVLDLKGEANALYETYLLEAVRLSLLGLAAITVLLLVALRSPVRVARILLPLAAAVLTVAAGLTLFGQRLTLLHVIGMLLIVAVGSNYALFFDRPQERESPQAALTLASLLVANCATVLGFGVIAFSSVPVLRDLGETVAPGAFLALLFAALLARGVARR